jgi:hypothetical protein
MNAFDIECLACTGPCFPFVTKMSGADSSMGFTSLGIFSAASVIRGHLAALRSRFRLKLMSFFESLEIRIVDT